jgi:hypothetical protein
MKISKRLNLKGLVVTAVLMLGVVAMAPTRLNAEEGLTASLKDDGGEATAHGWQGPEEQADENQLVRYLIHFACLENKGSTAQVTSMFDLSARRKLDATPFGASGIVRFQKAASSSDAVDSVELREAKAYYSASSLQATLGRFDLQPLVTPLCFFGAYPLMGARRVDGVMATIPIFFKLGNREDVSGSSAPLAIGLIYTPSLLSAESARMDNTQGFFLGQLRCRLETGDNQVVLRASGSKTRNSLFEFSSLSGDPCVSASLEWITHKTCALCGEWCVQNTSKTSETGVGAVGVRFERLATVGSFSLDGIWLEGQAPVKGSAENFFSGGNRFDPTLGEIPKFCWYARVKGRWGLMVWELQATTNRDDFTLARVEPSVMGLSQTGTLGPGRQGGDAGLPFKSTTYKVPAFMVCLGVPF